MKPNMNVKYIEVSVCVASIVNSLYLCSLHIFCAAQKELSTLDILLVLRVLRLFKLFGSIKRYGFFFLPKVFL